MPQDSPTDARKVSRIMATPTLSENVSCVFYISRSAMPDHYLKLANITEQFGIGVPLDRPLSTVPVFVVAVVSMVMQCNAAAAVMQTVQPYFFGTAVHCIHILSCVVCTHQQRNSNTQQ